MKWCNTGCSVFHLLPFCLLAPATIHLWWHRNRVVCVPHNLDALSSIEAWYNKLDGFCINNILLLHINCEKRCHVTNRKRAERVNERQQKKNSSPTTQYIFLYTYSMINEQQRSLYNAFCLSHALILIIVHGLRYSRRNITFRYVWGRA